MFGWLEKKRALALTEAKTSDELLAQSHLPRPENLMASLVAFKIAQMPADRTTTSYKQSFSIPLSDGRLLEVRCEISQIRDASASVGLPGPPGYRSVKLNREDQALILEQFNALVIRSKKLRAHEDAIESQNNALHILEGLI